MTGMLHIERLLNDQPENAPAVAKQEPIISPIVDVREEMVLAADIVSHRIRQRMQSQHYAFNVFEILEPRDL